MAGRVSRTAVVASCVSAMLAFASAAVTVYWLVGGTALLNTVGGSLERLARGRSAGALALAIVVVLLKAAGGALALVLLRWPSRRLATLAALGGALLALYGAVLAGAGLLVLTGVVSVSASDQHALRWHALFWDPWFFLWGSALAVGGVSVYRGQRAKSPSASDAGAGSRTPNSTPPHR